MNYQNNLTVTSTSNKKPDTTCHCKEICVSFIVYRLLFVQWCMNDTLTIIKNNMKNLSYIYNL